VLLIYGDGQSAGTKFGVVFWSTYHRWHSVCELGEFHRGVGSHLLLFDMFVAVRVRLSLALSYLIVVLCDYYAGLIIRP
jgi:hypothetical protein